jgi:hypothetical protein
VKESFKGGALSPFFVGMAGEAFSCNQRSAKKGTEGEGSCEVHFLGLGTWNFGQGIAMTERKEAVGLGLGGGSLISSSSSLMRTS